MDKQIKSSPEITPARVEAQLPVLLRDYSFWKRVNKIMKHAKSKLIIISPYKLSPNEVKLICSRLHGKDTKNLQIENEVDPELLLGIVIKYKDYYFDYSLRGRLEKLHESLIHI